jgi:F-type H+-transporting ATPase subunit delta
LSTGALQSKRYSQAVFELALERNELDKWQIDLGALDDLAKDIELVSAMDNPKFSYENKIKLLANQIKSVSKLAANLACLLVNKGSFRMLSEIYSEYRLMLDSYRGIEKAEVITAIPLEENEISSLAQQLGIMSGKKINLSLLVDPQIIGGIIVRIGGKIIDGSTRSQLVALKIELAGYSS